MSGDGKEKWLDGASYEGHYAKWKKDGFALYLWPDFFVV